MSANSSHLRVNLFYSYSHKDIQHKSAMERILASLRRNGVLRDWSDAQILPGERISEAIEERLSNSDIIAFLLSPDFLASEECVAEWNRAKELASTSRLVFRVPIIIRECPWEDHLADEDLKALPTDGTAITSYRDSDAVWKDVYGGIKSLVDSIRTTYTPKPSFLADLNDADIPASKSLSLDDIFVFPRLVKREYTNTNEMLREDPICSVDDLRRQGRSVIYGQDKSGKTALAKHLALSLVNDDQPVLFADLSTTTGKFGDRFLANLYEEQFNGDYNLWQRQENKSLIIDNMTESGKLLDYVSRCSETFEQIYLFVSTDVYHSFLIDDIRLADFHKIRLDPLTLHQQEVLIRKRLMMLDQPDGLTDGFIDQAEDRVNSIIISNRVVPRYPFYVLSILQTYDSSMPRPLSITSYGHCYYVFIIASLLRAGISEADDAVNSAFNFAEHLALATFRAKRIAENDQLDFEEFTNEYRSEYFMKKALLSRLTHKDYGIITSDGEFKTAYMYYFFLGKVLATNAEYAAEYLPDLCAHSYTEEDYLTLLFAIHHATDEGIIEDIAIRTMVELDDVSIATLSEEETARFATIVAGLPESVLSGRSVEAERAEERQSRQEHEQEESGDSDERDANDVEHSATRMLRVLKNNKILGQVLRNQYGKLPKTQIEDIVETIADSSFRVVNAILKDEEEILSLALYLHAVAPNASLEDLQEILKRWSFVWTMTSIEQAVHAVSVPSIREAVDSVVDRNPTPAYAIFGYFYMLDSGSELTADIRNEVERLYDMYRDGFVRRVVSIRTQWYMNTHHSATSMEQSICAALGIPYRARRRSGIAVIN